MFQLNLVISFIINFIVWIYLNFSLNYLKTGTHSLLYLCTIDSVDFLELEAKKYVKVHVVFSKLIIEAAKVGKTKKWIFEVQIRFDSNFELKIYHSDSLM